MKFRRTQLAGLVSQFGKEVGRSHPIPSPEQKVVAADQNVRIVGWRVQKRRDGARRLDFKFEMLDQRQTLILPCILVAEDVRQLAADLS
jgi:hypothetical protein